MEAILNLLAIPLGFLMRLSYSILGNYGWAILLFTVLARVVLLPISIWLHRYSIRLVKMTPALLETKAAYFGDNDRIAEEQAKLYKEYKYNPLITLVPLAIQIIMLMGVIQVINHPMEYILGIDQNVIAAISELTVAHLMLDPESSSIQLSAINLIQSGALTDAVAGLTGSFSAEALMAAIESIQAFNIRFFGINIMLIPSIEGGLTVLAPVVAGLAAFCLCVVQNKANALQHEQGMANRISTMLISVGLSAYLGYFVPMGVALYWVAGNFVAIVQQYFLNAIIPPKKHIDYAALEQSREKLRQLNETQTKVKRDPELVKREKEDYKRFFSIANKHLVFYSEKSGFYKYFQNTIDYLLNHSNVTIHYVTNDPNDQIFKIAKEKTRIKPYYIGPQKIITFMMKMDADIVVMTTPDLENYFIKRSYVRKDIEYIYMFHGMTSTNMVVRKGAYDHFDTIFCVGQHQIDELRESEKMYGLPEKNLIPCGYGMFDNLLEAYQKMEQRSDKQLQIMIAPSWQEGNILDTCLEQMLDVLQKKDCKAILRPHPEYIKRYPAKMERVRAICGKYDAGRLELQTDFSSNETIYTSDMLITDWSGIAHEFSYTTKRPSLFIDTPIKVLNEDYDKYQNKPMDITLRNQLGQSVPLDEMDRFEAVFDSVISQRDAYAKEIEEIVNRYVFNIGSSGKAGALYILKRLQKRKG